MLDNEEDAITASATATPSNLSPSMTDSGVSMGMGSSAYSPFSSKDGDGMPAIMKSIRRPPDKSFIEMTMSGRREKLGASFSEQAADVNIPSLDPGLPSFMKSSSLPSATRANRPKWKVMSVSKFTQTGSKLVRERHIAAASLGINHSALMTGMYVVHVNTCVCMYALYVCVYVCMYVCVCMHVCMCVVHVKYVCMFIMY